MKIKKFLRRIAFILIIIIACVIPLPFSIQSYRKDEKPTYVVEQVETKKEEDQEEDIKELF